MLFDISLFRIEAGSPVGLPVGRLRGTLLSNPMTTTEMIAKAQETMKLAAQAFADKGETTFKAAMHQAICGHILSKHIAGGGATDAKTLTTLFAAISNHSHWRQVLEREGVFTAKKEAKNDYSDLLNEEGV